MEPRPPLIVCFGDSLTAGYQSPTASCPEVRETPYGVFLQERAGARARVAVSGLCGELTDTMARRFPRDVLALAPAYVVILGGTNDLGWDRQPIDIVTHLRTMYEAALASGVRPVSVTVPSIRLGGSTTEPETAAFLRDHLDRRRVLNRLIAETSRELGIPGVDLFTATSDPGTSQLAARYSNDGLHLTTEGYRLMADLLYEQVFAAVLER